MSLEDLAELARRLEALAAEPGRFLDDPRGPLRPVRAAASRLVAALQAESRARKGYGEEGRRRVAAAAERDAARRARSGMRRRRAEAAPAFASAAFEADGAADEGYERAFRCLVCAARGRAPHAFYDAMCPPCGDESLRHRRDEADLRGRRAIVTGGRIKIGFAVAHKLLRCGAEVEVTTRFPCDAARRFAALPGAEAWGERLTITGLDLRRLPEVEAFAGRRAGEPLDILINNAAQTIRRPPGFYARELAAEAAGPAALPLPAQGLLGELVGPAADETSAMLALAEPPRDEHGQPLDLRARHSWVLGLEELSAAELVEVQAINAIAPALLIRRLLPALRASPRPGRVIVNVSSAEGRFSQRRKAPDHPHTNMAKAALDMLTRTSAEALAEDGVTLVSVDPGWVTAMQPGSETSPPLDEEDGAARILHPVFAAARTGAAPRGVRLAHFRPQPW